MPKPAETTRVMGVTKPAIRIQKEFLRPWLLLLLAEDSGYGYELRQQLSNRGFHADPSSVYRNLREMEEQKLVNSRWSSDSDGPSRRMYTLTPRGRKELERTAFAFAGARNAQSAFLRAYRSTFG